VLQVGNLPTFEQNRAHFGAWCIISAPLYLGFDLRNRSLVDSMMPIIGNPEAISVNQQFAVRRSWHARTLDTT
jgi:alpha-galactosidase